MTESRGRGSGSPAEPPTFRDSPFPDSLCHRCTFRRVVDGRASVFLRCTAPSLAVKYPPQPVRSCVAFEPLVPERP